MTSRELKFLAMMHQMEAAKLRLAAACADAGEAMHQMADVMQQGYDTDVATHPDLAELNVQLDGFYGDTQGTP